MDELGAVDILLLEDDPAIAATVVFALQREGWQVQHHLLVSAAQDAALREPPDIAILDIGLPDGNGLGLCRQWRMGRHEQLKILPVIMLSAQGEEIDKVLGLETGADDYLTKPFSPRELVARIKAQLRRQSYARPAIGRELGHGFSWDREGACIRQGSQMVPLTRLEYGLLAALLNHPGRVRSREVLLNEVWGYSSEATDRTVDTHIKTLRAKLREYAPHAELITTHRGQGYSIASSTEN